MRSEFVAAIEKNRSAFAIDVSSEHLDRLADYYDLVQQHNPLLHLVAPSSPEEFAIRHILESLTLLNHLPQNARLADVGTGAGLPSIPCLVVREDIRSILIESKEKKAAFLYEAVTTLGINARAEVVNKQYSETDAADARFVTSRALDKFSEKLPHLVRWSRKRTMLLFGGNALKETLQNLQLRFVQELIPMSERRYLFVVKQ